MIARSRVRQLGLGDLLDETFRIYRGGFVTFVAIAALVYVPYALLSLVVGLPFAREMQRMQTAASSVVAPGDLESMMELFSGMLFWGLGSLGLGTVYGILVLPLLDGALTRAVSQHYLGQPLSVGDSFATALRRAWPLIGSRLLTMLLGAPLVLVGVIVYIAGIFAFIGSLAQTAAVAPSARSIVAQLAITLLGLGIMLAGMIVFLLVWTRLLFAQQAAVLEQHGAWGSVQRSWRLTHGFFWRTLGFVLVLLLLVWLVTAIPSAAFTVPVALLFPGNFTRQTLLSTLVSSIMTVIVLPFAAIAYTLMYYDLRVRKEAFDLQQRAGEVLPAAQGYGLSGAP